MSADCGPRKATQKTSGAGATTSRAKRRDSLDNADKVLAAALEVCSERGIAVTLPEVAARAGVGRATVYRSFGSRDDLVVKIMAVKLIALSTVIADLAREDDAWTAMVRILESAMSAVRTDRLLADACVLRPDLLEPHHRTRTLAELVARTQQQGSVRPDVTESDVRLLISGLAHSLSVSGEQEPAAWQRAAQLIAHAIKADQWQQ